MRSSTDVSSDIKLPLPRHATRLSRPLSAAPGPRLPRWAASRKESMHGAGRGGIWAKRWAQKRGPIILLRENKCMSSQCLVNSCHLISVDFVPPLFQRTGCHDAGSDSSVFRSSRKDSLLEGPRPSPPSAAALLRSLTSCAALHGTVRVSFSFLLNLHVLHIEKESVK